MRSILACFSLLLCSLLAASAPVSASNLVSGEDYPCKDPRVGGVRCVVSYEMCSLMRKIELQDQEVGDPTSLDDIEVQTPKWVCQMPSSDPPESP